MVGGRPDEEKGDERTRRWWWEEEGVGGGDDAEGKEASLNALVARAVGLNHNTPALMLKQRRAVVLRARVLPPPVTTDSIARQLEGTWWGLGRGAKRSVCEFPGAI